MDSIFDERHNLNVLKIDLADLDPEKAKIAAQAKWAAIEDSFKIIDKIEQVDETKKDTEKESIKFLGVENRVK